MILIVFPSYFIYTCSPCSLCSLIFLSHHARKNIYFLSRKHIFFSYRYHRKNGEHREHGKHRLTFFNFLKKTIDILKDLWYNILKEGRKALKQLKKGEHQ